MTLTLKADDSPQGRALKAALLAHDKLGFPVRIDAASITHVEGPEIVKTFLNEIGSFVLPGSPKELSFLVRLEIDRHDGSRFESEPIELKLVERLSDGVVLKNSHSQAPLQATVILKHPKCASFTFQFDSGIANAFQQLWYFNFLEALASAKNFVVTDVSTGLRLGMASNPDQLVTPPDAEWKVLIQQLAAIQQKTGIVIPVGTLRMTDKTKRAVFNVFNAVIAAQWEYEDGEASASGDAEFAKEMIRLFEQNTEFNMAQGVKPEVASVAGVKIDLGPSVLSFEAIHINGLSITQVREQLEQNPPPGTFSVAFERARGVRIFPKWLPPDAKMPPHVADFLKTYREDSDQMDDLTSSEA